MKKDKVVWFAKGGGIAKAGPFKDQVEAAAALTLVPKGPHDLRVKPDDAFVWPERVPCLKRNGNSTRI